jgi:hypothetical protein
MCIFPLLLEGLTTLVDILVGHILIDGFLEHLANPGCSIDGVGGVFGFLEEGAMLVGLESFMKDPGE